MSQQPAKERFASLSVVIMAYNELSLAKSTVEGLAQWLEARVDDWEIVFVDDGSQDGTGQSIMDLASREPRIRLITHPQNMGMGAAIRSGYLAASKDWVTQIPADGQVPPEIIGLLLQRSLGFPMVLSIYDERGDGPLRTLLSWGFATMGRLILGHKSNFTGTMLLRRTLLEGLPMSSQTFLLNLEVPLRLISKGFSYGLITFRPLPRREGRSKVLGLKKIVWVLAEMFKLRIRWSLEKK